ncbi:hypothetical protein D0Z07_1353 [Hyphodiscus hymeniophilus]|uniref:Uncharacterized protein n=1 Tax=Hyphodiscus hymeniophilus TaxID=353542 RepID=A0A9P6VRK0_9HELO|nr:hypothetical protein D0Z07_1353 [Hyphodiscus hymeniophilus]
MLDLLEAVLKFGEVLVASSTLKSENINRFRSLESSIQGIRQVWSGNAATKPSSVENMAEMYRLAALNDGKISWAFPIRDRGREVRIRDTRQAQGMRTCISIMHLGMRGSNRRETEYDPGADF